MNMLKKKRLIPGVLLFGYLAAACFMSCGEAATDTTVASAEARYSKLSNPASGEVKASREDLTAAMQDLAAAYLAFADQHPDAPETPERLYKAAELFQVNLLDVNQALEIYDRIFARYPDHKRAANSLFTKAYVYHNTVHDLDMARASYLQFIEKYPDHELAAHAQFELDNLGLSAREALERIQARPDTVSE
mgnify:CR=1 FL=1